MANKINNFVLYIIFKYILTFLNLKENFKNYLILLKGKGKL